MADRRGSGGRVGKLTVISISWKSGGLDSKEERCTTNKGEVKHTQKERVVKCTDRLKNKNRGKKGDFWRQPK